MFTKISIAILAVSVSLLTGCATHKGSLASKEIDGLKSQVQNLEIQLAEKDETIYELEKKLRDTQTTAKTSTKISSIRKDVAFTSKKIQNALKNAGFYKGLIDGKIGPNTTAAIKEFQKANGLKPDGIVGKKTKTILAKYLSEENCW